MEKLSFCVSPDGKLPPFIAQTLTAMLKDLAGKPASVELKEITKLRSIDANAYYWGCIVLTLQKHRMGQGESVSLYEVHEDLLSCCALPVKRRGLDGTIRLLPQRSSAMNKTEFHEYIMRICALMADFEINLPCHPKYDLTNT